MNNAATAIGLHRAFSLVFMALVHQAEPEGPTRQIAFDELAWLIGALPKRELHTVELARNTVDL